MSNTIHTITLKEVTGDFTVTWVYEDYQQALEKYMNVCSDRAKHQALIADRGIFQITLVSALSGGTVYKTCGTMIQSLDFKN